MYQKSPFPYLIILVMIIGISCFTNLTIDKEIEQPIIHEIHENTTANGSFIDQEFKLEESSSQIATIQ